MNSSFFSKLLTKKSVLYLAVLVLLTICAASEAVDAVVASPVTASPADAAISVPSDAPVSDSADATNDWGEGQETDINRQFEELLDASNESSVTVTRNLMGGVLRRLPRYGMSFFRQPPSTYAPIESMPVPPGYTLGPDDRLDITLWGMVENSFSVTVNRDGLVNVPHIGAVRLAGQTMEQARRTLKAEFDRYFTDYQLNVTVAGLRSVTIYVTGDVRRPGAYTVSSFATLVNALLASGGPSNSGTLRRIELRRGGRTITTFDMYDLLLRGDKSKDVRLLPEDVIFVPPVGPLVGLAGEIRRPGVYELKTRTRVKDLLYLAGGVSAQTFKGRIQYYTITDRTYRVVFEGSVDGLAERVLSDGDILRLFPVIEVPTVVRIGGPVGRPGTYGIVPGVTRVSELISQAGGLLMMASNIGELTRVSPTPAGPKTTRFNIDLSAAIKGDRAHDLTLEVGDHLLVQILPEWETQRMVTLSGEIMRPGTYAVAKGERLSDLIRRSGGFTSRAHLRGAVFTRRRVAEEQRRALNRMADQMEQDLLEAIRESPADAVAREELRRSRELIARLRSVEMPGRIVIKLDVPQALENTPWNLELEHGDQLRIPIMPSTVDVMGAVYASSTHVHNPRMGINDYINASGGYLRSAHKRMLYLMKSDGSIVRLTRNTGMLSSGAWTPPRGFSAVVEPGDIIIAPLKHTDRRSMETLKDVIDIMYKIAVSVGVLIRL